MTRKTYFGFVTATPFSAFLPPAFCQSRPSAYRLLEDGVCGVMVPVSSVVPSEFSMRKDGQGMAELGGARVRAVPPASETCMQPTLLGSWRPQVGLLCVAAHTSPLLTNNETKPHTTKQPSNIVVILGSTSLPDFLSETYRFWVNSGFNLSGEGHWADR